MMIIILEACSSKTYVRKCCDWNAWLQLNIGYKIISFKTKVKHNLHIVKLRELANKDDQKIWDLSKHRRSEDRKLHAIKCVTPRVMI